MHVLFLRLEFVSSFFFTVSLQSRGPSLSPVGAVSPPRPPSVGRDVMVGLRRTQETEPLLVLPLFRHL